LKRYASVIGLDEAQKADYRRVHAEVWPGVLGMIKSCNIRNYSIFLKEPENLLFSYLEYHGADWQADQALMAADPVTQTWWDVCNPMQRPLDTRAEGEWWAGLTEVFHTD